MIDEKHRLISEESEAFEIKLKELPQNVSDVWKKIVGYIRIKYDMMDIEMNSNLQSMIAEIEIPKLPS